MEVEKQDDEPEQREWTDWTPEGETRTEEPWKRWTPEELAQWEEQFGSDEEIEKKKKKIADEGLTANVRLVLG